MAFFGILALLVFVGAIVWPQFWIKRVMARHNVVREDFPGTGGEFAQHLIERFELLDVGVEETEGGDHYDPESKTVRLSKTHFHEATLTGVAVAAHEVGHALQDANTERSFRLQWFGEQCPCHRPFCQRVFYRSSVVWCISAKSASWIHFCCNWRCLSRHAGAGASDNFAGRV